MQDAEDEGKVHAGHQGPTGAEGSVLTYVTEPESRKQRSRSPSCNSLKAKIELQLSKCLVASHFSPF